MALDLLDTPVRLTWDFPVAAPGVAAGRLPAIAARVAGAGVFFVTLLGRPLLHPELGAVLDALAGHGVLAACRGGADELAALADLNGAGLQLMLDATGFTRPGRGLDLIGLGAAHDGLRRAGYEPLVALTPLRSNLPDIPKFLRFCSDRGVARIKLPNAHIGDSFHDYPPEELPRWQDLAGFAGAWRAFLEHPCPLPAMEIHDLFLWEIMTPGEQQNRAEYGGCQAGNSLAHVDADGVVHPCAAWPLPLGTLPGESLEDIWAGNTRLELRGRIAGTPSGCVGCRDLDICFGGCRGLSAHLNRAAGGRDLMCAGPR